MLTQGDPNTQSRLHPIEQVSRNRWETAVERLIAGHFYRGQGNGPALITGVGCIIPRKSANRADHGYIQVKPVNLGGDQNREPEISPQLAHRVVCYLHKTPEQVALMLYSKYHASHLCGVECCINHAHLAIETKQMNEARKACSQKVCIITVINGVRYSLDPAPCPHHPPCIFKVETRNAIRIA